MTNMHSYRTHTCAQLRASNVGETIRLSGWVHRKRDHGGLLFVDLRDHYGLTQIVTDVDSDVFRTLDKARAESVVTITGEVVARDAATVNANLPTGEIEVRARAVSVQSAAQELPMPVFGDAEYPEEIRLKYRYLDLRRERLHNNIVLRSKVISSALRTAVTVAQALTGQKLVLDQITALNTTTANVIDATGVMLRTQTAEIHKQAASSTIPVETLKQAFTNIYATMDSIDTFKAQALVSMKTTVDTLSSEVEKSRGYIARAEGMAQIEGKTGVEALTPIEA